MENEHKHTNITFIGLGAMGYPMAGHLSRAGFSVTVWNRSAQKAQEWCNTYAGKSASTPIEAVQNADCVLMCLGNDQSVDHVVCHQENGILPYMQAGSLLIDHTTTSADLAHKLHTQAKTYQVGFVDAPVSGGQAGAQNGKLTIMCGGDKHDFQRAEPLMKTYAAKVRHLGAAGNGQLCKMVNQICSAGLVQALAEGVNFALKSGLDAHHVFETISTGAAGSWQMDNRHKWMIDGDFQDDKGFALDWMRKDLGMCIDHAQRLGIELPITELIDGFYAQLQNRGKGRLDTAALIERMR